MELIAKILLPVFVAALLTSILTRQRKERERIKASAKKFVATFASARQRLIKHEAMDRMILAEEFSSHERAFFEFFDSLPKRKQPALMKIWNNYKEHYKQRAEVDPVIMFGTEFSTPQKFGDPSDAEQVRRKNCTQALAHIDALIDFAKKL